MRIAPIKRLAIFIKIQYTDTPKLYSKNMRENTQLIITFFVRCSW